MFLGVGEEGWEQLFSGSVGGMISAIIGASVAMLVLRRTNRHQRELSDKQLTEQRAGASNVRRNEAIARMIFAATQFRQTADDQTRHALIADMESAALIWEFEESNEALFAELQLWPQLLFVESAKIFKNESDGAALHNQVMRVSGLAYSFTRNLKLWPSADAEGRVEIIDNLAAARGPIFVKFLIPPGETRPDGDD